MTRMNHCPKRPSTTVRRRTAALKKASFVTCALVYAGGAFAQTTVDLAVRSSAGSQTVYLAPGEALDYEIAAELGGDPSEGLAMFAFDLSYSGGSLTQVVPPASGPLLEFVAPQGFNNPEGYGGTQRGGDLLQIGGAMNTIANTFAASPAGTVATGVANGGEVLLATGSLTAPNQTGTFEVVISNVFANALDELDPAGFWRVQPALAGTLDALTIVVLDCAPTNYCTGKVNSAGCVATITANGSASLGGASALTLTANEVINSQFGVLVWSLQQAQTPMWNGTLCVAQPFNRVLPVTVSGGSGPFGSNCTGSLSQVIDASFLTSAGLTAGDTVYCQWLYRDRFQPDGTTVGLTDGVRFTVCP